MPVREPKGRYLKREFFEDHEFQTSLSAEQQLCYLGIAMFADDAGWLKWEPEYIKSFIYRYAAPKVRDSRFARAVERLQATGRLALQPCGQHAHLSRVSGKRAGEHEKRVLEEHSHECLGGNQVNNPSQPESSRVDSSTSPHLTLPNLTSPRAGARAQGGAPQSLKEIVGWQPGKEAKS